MKVNYEYTHIMNSRTNYDFVHGILSNYVSYMITSDTTLYCKCYSIIVVTCFDNRMSSSDHTYIKHVRSAHVEEYCK
jgi:hypothetical protein